MPRLDPKAAARFRHLRPQRRKMFARPLTGPASLEAMMEFVAAAYAAGVPGNAAMVAEGPQMVARWTVPMEDYPRNR